MIRNQYPELQTFTGSLEYHSKRLTDILINKHVDNVYTTIMDEVEKHIIFEAMLLANGNQSEAARMLGTNRGTLRTKCKKYSIKL